MSGSHPYYPHPYSAPDAQAAYYAANPPAAHLTSALPGDQYVANPPATYVAPGWPHPYAASGPSHPYAAHGPPDHPDVYASSGSSSSRSLPAQPVYNFEGADYGGPQHQQLLTPDSLDSVKTSFINIFAGIQQCMSQASLTKPQKRIRNELYEDIKSLRDLILVVLDAHRGVATTARQMLNRRGGPHPNDAQVLLSGARKSVKSVQSAVVYASQRIRRRMATLNEAALLPAGSLQNIFHALVRLKIPEISIVTGTTGGIAAAVNSTANLDRIEENMHGERRIQGVLAVGAVLLGTTVGSGVSYLGRNAGVYKASSRKATTDALLVASKLADDLSEVLGDLELYWGRNHLTALKDVGTSVDDEKLSRIVILMDKHVDDCLDMACAIQRHIPMTGTVTLPTHNELDMQRRREYNGVPALPKFHDRYPRQ